MHIYMDRYKQNHLGRWDFCKCNIKLADDCENVEWLHVWIFVYVYTWSEISCYKDCNDIYARFGGGCRQVLGKTKKKMSSVLFSKDQGNFKKMCDDL